MSIYDPKNKIVTHEGQEYYFYNGKPDHDWQSLIVVRLLDRGFVPNHKNELVEIYLDLCAGDICGNSEYRSKLSRLGKIRLYIVNKLLGRIV